MKTPVFEVGQRVIALTDPEDRFCQPRKKGSIYTVKAVAYCDRTGAQRINIGHAATSAFLECTTCGGNHPTHGLRWTRSVHFAPVTEDTMLSLAEQEECELTEAIKKEL